MSEAWFQQLRDELEASLKLANDEIDRLNSSHLQLRKTLQAQQANLAIAAELLEEERAKVAHRDELLRIQGEACERYKAALEEIKLTPLCNSPAYSMFSKAQMRQENLDMFRVAVKALEETEGEA